MKLRAATTPGLDLSRTLQLRIDTPSPETSKAAITDDAAVMVPWPMPASSLIDYYLSNPWLGAIGNLLCDAVASADWELVAREVDTDGELLDRGKDWDRETDANYARARTWLSRETIGREGVSELGLPGLLRALTSAYDQTGNVFIEVIRDRAGREPLQMQHLLPQFVRYWARNGQLELYQLDPIRGEFSFVPFGERKAGDTEAREYLHQRATNTASSYYGIPAWITARDSVDVDTEHRRYLKGFFKRHGTPRYMIEISQDPEWLGAQPSDDDRDGLFEHVRSFLNANAGDMAGRNLIVQYPGGITVKATPLDVKIEDPTFPNTSKNMRDEILAVRHISLINLGLPEGGYRATAEQQATDFATQVLRPFAAPAVAIINRILHAPAPSGLGITDYDFALNFKSIEDTLKRIEGIVKAVGAPILTQVEGRQMLGYEAKGEDEVLLPASMLPGGDLLSGGPDGAPEE